MELYRMGVNKGLKIYFKGEEYGKTLKESVSCAYGDSIDEIIMSMKKRLISFWEFITIDSGLDFKETMFNPKILSLYDTIKTMEFIPKSIINRNELNLFIDNMFKNEGNEGIQLSTIHRAKGLEADNVFIICPSLIPSRLSRMEWEFEEEKHLQYVMCTRPKNSLNFVTERDIRPHSAFSENNSLYKELISIKNSIKDEN
jgi:superfamily I DNA/RNA helicase